MTSLKRPPRSLAILLQALTETILVIELRHDVQVRGILDSVDINMNITLREAEFLKGPAASHKKNGGDLTKLELMYVSSRHITFIHLPPDLDVFDTVDTHVSRLRALSYSATGGKRRRNK